MAVLVCVMNNIQNNRRFLLWLVFLFCIVSLFYIPVLEVKLFFHTKQEFGSHAEFADRMIHNLESVPKFIIAHPLYALSEVGLMRLFNISSRTAGMVVSLLAYFLLAGIIFREARMLSKGRKGADFLALVVTIIAMIGSHIPILVFIDREIYFGYIGINAYNNATSNYLKPFALAAFLFISKSYDSEQKVSKYHIFITAALVFVSTLVKPSFIICILPAAILLSCLRLRYHQATNWKMILGGLVLPSIITLGFQFILNYGQGTSRIIFLPLGVKKYYSDEIILKFIFSILFPLLVARAHFQSICKDPKLSLAWISFLIGSFYAYFLAENSGGGLLHGNFDWSSEITLFILYVVSLLYFIKSKINYPTINNWDKIIILALALHVASGILFYLFNLRIDSYSYLPSIRRIFGDGFH